MKQLLLEHLKKYPEMQPQDLFKLLYQSEFGGGHLIADRQRALAYLENEIASVRGTTERGFEDIGGGLTRLYLPAENLRPETVLGLFLETCTPRGSLENMLKKLSLLEEMFPAMRPEIDAYRAEGCPMQRHSETYRAAYSPAYRLAPAAAKEFLALFEQIDRLLREKPFVRIAVEGRCASGKSTLAALLERVYGANLVHMDDFFLPFARKTPERLAEPGGNVDYERVLAEILSHPAEQEIVYRPFDCSAQALSDEIRLAPKPLTIVEGSYSMHPALRGHYDLSVFLDIDPEKQSARILKRNGPEMHARFVGEWIPLENRYFDGLNVRQSCTLSFDR